MIKQLLDAADNNIRQAKNILFASNIIKKADNLEKDNGSHVIEGIFDGENMRDADGKIYPVSANYASKSKLIPGDILKLTIVEDGSFLFKQIGPVERKKLVGEVVEAAKGKFIVKTSSGQYNVLLASITYYKAKDKDKVTIIVPEEEESEWAAIENLLQDTKEN